MIEIFLEAALGVILMAAPIHFDLSSSSGALFWIGSFLFLLLAFVRFIFRERRPPGHRVPLAPDMSLECVVETILGTAQVLGHGEKHTNKLLDLLQDIGQAAAHGILTVWGRSQPEVLRVVGVRSNSVEIPQSYWENHVIHEIAYIKNCEGKTRTVLYDEEDAYIDLSFCSEEIKAFRRQWIKKNRHKKEKTI